MRNEEVARILNLIADLYEIRGHNSFKVRSYRKAAAALDKWRHSTLDAEALRRHSEEAMRAAEDVARLAAAASSDAAGSLHDK